MARAAILAPALLAALALAACGGAAQMTPAVPPAPPLSKTARDRAAAKLHVDPATAAQVISKYRHDHGLGAVTPDPVLQRLAQAQADAMAAHNLLSHTVAGTLTQRFDAVHLSQAQAVENVAAGYFSLSHVMTGWEHSPGHNANLLSPSMRRLGIATAAAPGTRYAVFWALDMSD